MPDSRKVHLLIERDPVSDPPNNRRLVLESRGPNHNGFDLARFENGQWAQRRVASRPWNMPPPTWWAELPTASDLTVEDVQTLIAAALADASQEEHDAEHQGPTKAAQRLRSAAETREAVVRLRAALGLEDGNG